MANLPSIYVHVTPRSGRDEVQGIRLDAQGAEEICVRVTAAPDGGKANKAVCKAVASSLRIAKTKVEVTSGQTARRKRLSIDIDQDALDAWRSALPRL